MARNSLAAFALAMSISVWQPAAAQSIGASLAGAVHDESGARLAGVTLTLTNTSNGRTQTVISPELLRLDPYRTLDIRLTKLVQTGGRRRLELTLEAFNVTNYVNYNPVTVNRNINSAAFLQRRSARPARQIQWGLRYVF